MFSIVFPKIELFINLKKSFSKSLVAAVLSWVLKSKKSLTMAFDRILLLDGFHLASIRVAVLGSMLECG